MTNNHLYWYSTNENKIFRSNLDGSDSTMFKLLSSDIFLNDLEVDGANNRVFYSTPITVGGVFIVDLLGNNIDTLTDINAAFMHFDRMNQKIYYRDHASGIYVVDYDGNNNTLITTGSGGSLFLDEYNSHLYVADYQYDNVIRMNLDGTDQVSIFDIPLYYFPKPFLVRVNTFTISLSAYPSAGGTFTGNGNYFAQDSVTITATPNAGYYFYGWSENGTILSNDTSYTFVATAHRNLVAEFYDPLGIDMLSKNEMHLFPNPTSGIVNFNESEIVELTNVLGNKIVQKSNVSSLDLSDLQEGVYFLIFKNKQGEVKVLNKVIKK